MRLSEWLDRQPRPDAGDFIFRPAMWHQAMFVRDVLARLIATGLEFPYRYEASVIGEHTSKSVLLPVYELARPDLGLRMVARNNFYDWKLSVEAGSIEDTEAVFSCLFRTRPPPDPKYTGNPLSHVYFEGFRREDVHGYYCQNRNRWSAEIADDYRMWTVVFLLMRAAGAVKPMAWAARPKEDK